jgi:hypothetical protein
VPPLAIDAAAQPRDSDPVVNLPLVPYEAESSRSLEHALSKLCSLDTIPAAGSIRVDFCGTMESVLMSLIRGKDPMQILLEQPVTRRRSRAPVVRRCVVPIELSCPCLSLLCQWLTMVCPCWCRGRRRCRLARVITVQPRASGRSL